MAPFLRRASLRALRQGPRTPSSSKSWGTHIHSGAPEEGGLRWWANVDLIYLVAAAAAEEQRGQ
jgi:hypothetical protein